MSSCVTLTRHWPAGSLAGPGAGGCRVSAHCSLGAAVRLTLGRQGSLQRQLVTHSLRAAGARGLEKQEALWLVRVEQAQLQAMAELAS